MNWEQVAGTLDYQTRNLYAVYKRTIKGYACYWVFPSSLPKSRRSLKNAVAAGGLPSQGLTARLESGCVQVGK